MVSYLETSVKLLSASCGSLGQSASIWTINRPNDKIEKQKCIFLCTRKVFMGSMWSWELPPPVWSVSAQIPFLFSQWKLDLLGLLSNSGIFESMKLWRQMPIMSYLTKRHTYDQAEASVLGLKFGPKLLVDHLPQHDKLSASVVGSEKEQQSKSAFSHSKDPWTWANHLIYFHMMFGLGSHGGRLGKRVSLSIGPYGAWQSWWQQCSGTVWGLLM